MAQIHAAGVLAFTFAAVALSAADMSEGPLNLRTETFYSPPLEMTPGYVVNSDLDTFAIPFVSGQVAIHKFHAEIVGEDKTPTPLSEVYLHHLIIFNHIGKGNAGPCLFDTLPYAFGGGAEYRGTPSEYPFPYAYVTTGEENWTANIHAIRSEGVDDVKKCIECHCWDDPSSGGHIGCCEDGSVCHGAVDGAAKTYYLKYEITYSEITPSIIPLDILVIDGAQTSTHFGAICPVEYQVPAWNNGSLHHEDMHFAFSTRGLLAHKVSLDIAFVAPHLHIGAVDSIFAHRDASGDIHMICHGLPTYGTEPGKPGNEDGYLVAISTCQMPEKLGSLYHVPAGEQLLMRSRYNTTSADKNAIYAYEGVMHLMYVAGIVGQQDGISTVYTIRDIVAARVGDSFDDEIIKFDWRFDGA